MQTTATIEANNVSMISFYYSDYYSTWGISSDEYQPFGVVGWYSDGGAISVTGLAYMRSEDPPRINVWAYNPTSSTINITLTIYPIFARIRTIYGYAG